MKKILVVSLIILLLIAIILIVQNFVITPYAVREYNSETGKITFHLKKGWSAMPIISGDNFGNNCEIFGEKEFVGVMWIWSPTQKRYYHIGEASESQEFKNDFNNKYYYTVYGGLFVYLTKDCDIWINDYKTIGPDNFKIAEGWQLVARHPAITKKGFDVFKNCNIEKFNKWDNEAQKWAYETSGTSLDDLKNIFNQAETGEIFFMKFSSECTLEISIGDLLPQPPALE